MKNIDDVKQINVKAMEKAEELEEFLRDKLSESDFKKFSVLFKEMTMLGLLENRIIELEKEIRYLHPERYCSVCGSLKSTSGFCLNRNCYVDTVNKMEEKESEMLEKIRNRGD